METLWRICDIVVDNGINHVFIMVFNCTMGPTHFELKLEDV